MKVGGIVAGATLLAACSFPATDHDAANDHHGTAATASAQASDHNAADVSFATEMIPHHRQALEMTKLAQTKALNAQVKDLATRISKAQEPEIATMSTWLTAWGQPAPADMNHENMSAPPSSTTAGMMTAEQMSELAATTGTAFDHAFLTMMIDHHEGAIAMAKTEQVNGSSPDAKSLAGTIISSQTAEITEMRQLLTTM